MNNDTDTGKRLQEIYIARNNEYIALKRDGYTREQILPRLQHYQDEIDALLYPKDRKPEKKNIGDIVNIYKIIDLYSAPRINGIAKYARIAIRKIGYERLLEVENGEELWEAYIEPEELEDWLSNKK